MATEVDELNNGLERRSRSGSTSESKAISNEEEGVTVDECQTTDNMKCGWLKKRTKLSHKWGRRWFLLKSKMLYYGNDAENLDKFIPLGNTEIAEADIDRRQFVFRLKPSDSRRTYYLQSDTKEELQEWMQAICIAKAANHHGDTSQACSIQ